MIFPQQETTWDEMHDTFALYRAEEVARHRDAGRTKTQAAQRLGMTLGNLSNFISRNGIPWTPPQQGKRQ